MKKIIMVKIEMFNKIMEKLNMVQLEMVKLTMGK
jgi:hypothetical protein